MRLFGRKKKEEKRARGRIFDMRKEELPGEATRVRIYLKGCPLSCVWCAVPEGISPEREPEWLEEKCCGCHACVEASGAGGVRLEGDRLLVTPEAAEGWDALISRCPTGALRWNSEDRTADEILEELREELPRLRREGGGIVLTGGDPLIQGPFVSALLKACRREKIPVSMESELFAPWEAVDALAWDLNVLFADLKFLDAALAKRYTGKGTMLIRDNVSRLMDSPHKERVVFRTPLIPGITATEENISSIAGYIASFDPAAPYELLNYDESAPAKYARLRRPYFDPDLKALTEEEMETFARIARMAGLENVRAVPAPAGADRTPR